MTESGRLKWRSSRGTLAADDPSSSFDMASPRLRVRPLDSIDFPSNVREWNDNAELLIQQILATEATLPVAPPSPVDILNTLDESSIE